MLGDDGWLIKCRRVSAQRRENGGNELGHVPVAYQQLPGRSFDDAKLALLEKSLIRHQTLTQLHQVYAENKTKLRPILSKPGTPADSEPAQFYI